MDTHPPGLFQIDGNLGAANGMLEALVQSRWTPDFVELELLPALPVQWSEGSLDGVHLRGGATIDMRWKSGKIVSLSLHSKSQGTVRLIPPQGQAVASVRTQEGNPLFVKKDGTVHFMSGRSYSVTFR
jgi:alpha-L-fucosidase 2